jgi:hypothetical protein
VGVPIWMFCFVFGDKKKNKNTTQSEQSKTQPENDRNIDKIDVPNTHIHAIQLYWLCTSIK